MTRTLELPEEVYERLIQAARHGGLSPANWIAERLPKPEEEKSLDSESLRAARERLWNCVVSVDHAVGTDNEQIDADLARSYLDPHDETDEPGR